MNILGRLGLILLSTALLLAPAVAVGAGFAKDPLFLSSSPVTEGQTVHVYAVITNTSNAAFVGTLVFDDNGVRIGSESINLAAGGTETGSVLWTPAAGTHPVTAELVASDGAVAEQVSETFDVAANAAADTAPASAAQTQSAASIDSSAAIQKDIANVSPQAANASQPVFSAIDGARNNAADFLDGQIAATKEKVAATPKPGIVAGASTEDVQIQNPSNGFWYWFYTAYLYILTALRWLIGNAGVFYPVLAILFLYLLWRLFRRYRRPTWDR